MPYNQDAVRADLKIAPVFASHTTGEYINKLATHLLDAAEEITALNRTTGERLLAQQAAERQLAAETAAHRETKDRFGQEKAILIAQKSTALIALDAISKDARGAKKIAQDAIAAINPPASAAAPVEAAKS